MTWASLTFSSLAFAALAMGASVSGTVRLSDSRDPAVRKHKDYSGVVLWLEPAGADVHPSTLNPLTARMTQKGKQFIPHVLAIPAGSRVTFPNLDPIFHSAFSNFSGQVFDLGLYAPGTTKTITFSRTGVVRVFCNIHPTMSAVIVVLNSPWFTVSSNTGAFQIPGVPPGEYRLRLFHERAGEGALQALERRLTIHGSDVVLSQLLISETGFVETPHKNKYGHEYPAGSDEHAPYPGGAQ